jgi:hypothetical protein
MSPDLRCTAFYEGRQPPAANFAMSILGMPRLFATIHPFLRCVLHIGRERERKEGKFWPQSRVTNRWQLHSTN